MSGATGGATSPPGSATARDGLVAAFVTEHAASLFRTALLLTGDRHRAEDLVQDVLTMLLPKWHRVAEAERPVAYVRRSLANQFISANRRRDTQVLLLGEVPEVDPMPDHADAVASSVTLCRCCVSCRRASALPWCSATSTAGPTSRSPPRWTAGAGRRGASSVGDWKH